MPKTKVSDLREMSDEQLGLTLKDTCENYFKLNIQAQTERLDAPSELRKSRRMIAAIKTVQRERELEKVLIVGARFYEKKTNKPITGNSFVARVFDKDLFIDDPMGQDHLDSNGDMRLCCDLEDTTRRDGLLKIMEGRPEVYVVLEKNGKEVFRSQPVRPKLHKGKKQELNLGVFKV